VSATVEFRGVDRQAVVVGRGHADPELMRPGSLHELFEAAADAHGGRTAVTLRGSEVTYSELEARANRLAHFLAGAGVSRGGRVALLLDRSVDTYVSILAVLKAGAAYVPLDVSYPPDRVAFILSDSGAQALVTTSARAPAGPAPVRTILLDREADAIASQPEGRLEGAEHRAQPRDIAYIIYTSGTTGRPKGVEVEHRSICHWIRAAQRVYAVQPDDRVYQGFSTAFDASLEEIWIALSNGATLVPAPPEMANAGPDMRAWLAAQGVTVLSCVPTLLTTFDEDIPSLRLLIFGGEALPQALAERWCRPGRRVLNTYGPTEATVTATWSEVRPGEPVRIGVPLPNCYLYVLTPALRPVPDVQPGQLFIGGACLARGYVNRPELTRDRFVPNPFREDRAVAPLLYETGDLVAWDAEGGLRFLGRVDDQVKIRGFRVELPEIEAQVASCPGVRAAAVSLRELTPGVESLVAYVVPASADTPLEVAAVESALRARLPPYMLPACYEPLPALPTLPSGKVDRKALPHPVLRLRAAAAEHTPPRTRLEREIAAVYAEVFHQERVSVTADFFDDLGGHSLLAAMAASSLRTREGLSHISVSDIYRAPTVELLARAVAGQPTRPRAPTAPAAPRRAERIPPRRHRWAGAAQAALVYALQIVFFYPVLVLAFASAGEALTPGRFALMAALLAVSYLPFILALSAVAKWTLIGRYRAGHYPLWGGFYLRFWLVRHITALVPLQWIAGTRLMPLYLRMMGARVGRDCHIDTIFVAAFDLLEVGDRTSVNQDANLVGYSVEGGTLHIGPVRLGSDCFVGAHSVLCAGARMEDGSGIAEHSMVAAGATVPAGQWWAGSPARAAPRPSGEPPFSAAAPATSRRRRARALVGHLVGLLTLPLVPLTASVPGAALLLGLYAQLGPVALLAAPLAAVLFVVTFCLETAALKWALLGRVREGVYPTDGGFYVRKWFVDRLLHQNGILMNSLFSTLYALPFFRLLGARIERNAEVERVAFVTPDLLTLRSGSFIADAVYLGAPRAHNGLLYVGRTEVGSRSFIGNSALLPSGAAIPDRCLVGIQSVPPARLDAGTAWLGSPAMLLPRRDIVRGFGEEQTYRPTWRLRAGRLAVEFLRVFVPPTLLIWLAAAGFLGARALFGNLAPWQAVALFPAVMLVAQAGCVAAAAAIKWAAVGRYRPTQAPLWSFFVWRSELATGLYESPATQSLVATLTGTPFLAPVWRLFGVRVGSRTFLDTTHVTEFDAVRIDDEAALNLNCGVQTHLFEDRVMKISGLHIGERCAVGSNSIVLYDTTMHPGSSLGPLSLLMKGESLPAETSWEGIPAVRSRELAEAAPAPERLAPRRAAEARGAPS